MDIDIDKLNIKSDLPIIGRIKDDLYPYHGYDHIRYVVRGLCEDESGRFVFLHIVGEDYFGVRDHLETSGGGVEENETLEQAMSRELKEELGCTIKTMEPVGIIVDTWNLIERISVSVFFHCLIDTKHLLDTHRTMEEEILIKEAVALEPEAALSRLENDAKSKVDRIVQRRDALALRYYLKHRK